jgi:8-oxo-dGTP pyrophosphatase MutT (NUDIX family)
MFGTRGRSHAVRAKALASRGHMRFTRPMSKTESSLAELLARHVPTDDKEREDLERMRAFATGLSRPFSRAQPDAHFTGSAVVVDPTGARVVLLHHGKLKRWLQPGGHSDEVDAGSMEATALREAREETGCQVRLHPSAPRPLDVDIHTIPARKDEPQHLHLDVRYLVIADDPEALVHDPAESFGAQWLSWEEALARADEPPLRRLLEKARAACP